VSRNYGVVMSGGDTRYRQCTVARTLTVQTVDVRTAEISLLRPTERLKLNYLLANKAELNSSSATQNHWNFIEHGDKTHSARWTQEVVDGRVRFGKRKL